MTSGLRHMIWLAGLMILQLVSCVEVTVPAPVQLPGFKLLSVDIDTTGDEPVVSLYAELESETELVSECGFMVGTNAKNLKKFPTTFNIDRFKITSSSFAYGTKYLFCAYIGNGQNLVTSDIDTLTIPEYQLPSSRPEDTEDKEDVADKDVLPDRYVEISHSSTSLYFYHTTCRESNGFYSWLRACCPDNHSVYWIIKCAENVSLEPRTMTLNMTENGSDYYRLQILQHSCLDIIDFQCPEVKKACVALWDKDGDGEISYEEADLVSGMKKEDFAGYDITSFNELRHFGYGAVSPIAPEDSMWGGMDYPSTCLFEGSSLKTVSLYSWPDCYLPFGIFKDCRNLESVDLGCYYVTAEAFMNCVSLTEIKASIIGPRAFMGCTGLESVVQHVIQVPDMAFKGCTNLKSFVFEEADSRNSSAIGEEAFCGCARLTNIAVPREIDMILDRAFYGCSSLESVSFESTQPPTLGADAFEGVSPELQILVPGPLIERYKKAWPDLAERIKGLG